MKEIEDAFDDLLWLSTIRSFLQDGKELQLEPDVNTIQALTRAIRYIKNRIDLGFSAADNNIGFRRPQANAHALAKRKWRDKRRATLRAKYKRYLENERK